MKILATIMIILEILSIAIASILMGRKKEGYYDLYWWISNLIQSAIVIILSLKVLGII